MKILVLALSLVLLLSASASALDIKKLLGIAPAAGTPEAASDSDEPRPTYIIHLKNGGKVSTDNYVIEKNSVRIIMLTGAVYLDMAMVKSIEEVKGEEQESVQTIKIQSDSPRRDAAPPAKTPPPPPPPPKDVKPSEDLDSNGHNQAWWQKRVQEWTDKKNDAIDKQKKADEEWNKYDGILQTMKPGTYTDYDVIRYQDLRGAARTTSDKAEADAAEADTMLNVTLPEEARKAGVPPGWLRP